jgi:5-formyltetrahydrofolate cyclo-ligase
LKQRYFRLVEPELSAPKVSVENVDLAVNACVTADHNGNRLGHGGGYPNILFSQYTHVPAVVICREMISVDEWSLESFEHPFPMTVTGLVYLQNN